MENEANTRTARKLNGRKLLVVTIQDGSILITEFCDNVENDVGAISKHRITKLVQLGAVLLQR